MLSKPAFDHFLRIALLQERCANEKPKKNERQILKNRNNYRINFEIQNYFVTLQRKNTPANDRNAVELIQPLCWVFKQQKLEHIVPGTMCKFANEKSDII